MADPREVDVEQIWKLARQGYSAKDLMKELDMKNRADLKNALEELLRKKGEKDVLRGLIGEVSLPDSQSMDGL